MRSFFAVLVAAGLLAACSTSESPDGWTTLFDGSDLDAFNEIGDANWTVDSGAVTADSGNGYLVTRDVYDNFDLEVEFWADEPANSGVFLRCPDPEDISAATCYEVNIFDTRPDQSYRTGAIVDVASPRVFVNASNRWNTFKITADGPKLTVELDGTALVDTEDSKFSSGHIGLQRTAGTVKFRSIKLRPR